MLVGLAVYQNRLAALFDSSIELRVYRQEDNKIYPAGQISLPHRDLYAKASTLSSCGVNYLVCGAITRVAANFVTLHKIKIVPWVCGEIDDVVKAWIANDLMSIAMPGCKKYCHRRIPCLCGQPSNCSRKRGKTNDEDSNQLPQQ